MKRNWKRILFITAIIVIAVLFTGCTASTQRACKSCNSNVNGGLNRIVRIYDYQGDLIAEYEGLIDIDDNDNGSVMFDLNGKRYVYYHAIAEVIEK